MRSQRTCVISAVLCALAYFCGSTLGDLPDDFPGITVTTHDPGRAGEGYIFLAVASETEGIGTYLMIVDNDGTPMWYQKIDTHEIYDFKVAPSGHLTYAPFIEAHRYTGGGDAIHEIRDDSYNLVETVTGADGYVAESHDFQLLPNGHILQFGYYMSEVDMSRIVDDGHPGALVSGGVVQELDADRKVVFQWRTWDTYPFEDLAGGRRTGAAVIAAFHLNAMSLDPDGNIVLGTPSEIRKINRQTGEVMWILGGSDNQFTVVGDEADVSHFGGHATYRLENGNFLMYDNGGRRGDPTSKVHEYALDEVHMTATHVWSWTPPADIPAWHRGNAQRLPNGNTLIGWGGASGEHIPACTEVAPNGDVVFELYFDEADPQVESYRAFRFLWPPATQAIEHMEIELAAGNDYDFGNTDVSIDVETGAGDYNECTVIREPYAPVYPVFPGKAPRVLPVRVKVEEHNIDTMTAEISFDAVSFGFDNPDSLTIWHRTTPGQGQFVRLPTNYNPATGKLRAHMTQFGEFIFAFPDVADIPFAPILNAPENYRGEQHVEPIAPPKAEPDVIYEVNQKLAILLSWSPTGLARWYFVQVATDQDFTNLVVDQSWMSECRYIWDGAEDNTTYYWRARINNEGGDGDWSTGTFRTVAPGIQVAAPSAREVLTPGLDYFIRWTDNIAEDVVIELYQADALVQEVATVPSDRAYEWEVDLALDAGCGYTFRIRSTVDENIVGISAPFRIGVAASDFDCDGCVDVVDFKMLADAWLADEGDLMVDPDGSGKVDFGDFSLFAEDWTGTCP